jgi:type IV pilus assembly protein PilQ
MTKESKWMLATAAAVMLTVAGSLAEAPSRTGPEAGHGAMPGASINLTDLAVRTDAHGGAEVTLAVDGKVRYESFLIDGPDRLVLDLLGTVSHLDQYRFDVHQGGVSRVRAGQHTAEPVPVTRVVFDLEGPVPYTISRTDGDLVVAFGEGSTASASNETPVAAPVVADGTAVVDNAAEDLTELQAIIRELESRHVETPEPTFESQARAADVAPIPAAPVATNAALDADEVGRAVDADLIDRLLDAPVLASPAEAYGSSNQQSSGGFETRTIVTDEVVYSGEEISLNLVDADLKQVFRLFNEISGLNFVLDPSVSGRVTIVLDRVPWDQALDIILKNNGLDKVFENNVMRIASTQKLAQEAASRKQLKEAKELEVEPITITRTLSYGKAADVERVIRDSGVLSTRGKVIVDERTNTLIISDIPKKVDPLDTLISTLDAETPQVMIEARVVETSRDFVQDLGVIWGVEAIADASKGTSTGLSFPHNASLRYGLNLPGEGGASSLAMKFGNVIDSFTLDVALNTLETEGTGRVLSSPKIATQNNERAEIEQGVRIPIVNTTATEINVEFVSASLKMTVTPQITAEGTIILEVMVENNSPDFVNTAGGIPSIRTQRAQTKVLISDGGTTVIGGIFTVNEGQSEIGVPWFRKLPVFGWLFKTQNITSQNRELLIFITPKIMRVA